MDWKQFFASIIGSLSWPVVVLIVILIFRREILRLLGHLKRIGAAGVSFELAQEIDAAQAHIERLGAQEGGALENVLQLEAKQLREKYKALHADNAEFPAAAVLFAWKELEAIVSELRIALDPAKPGRNQKEVLMALYKEGYVTSATLDAYFSLQKVRNTIVHTPEGDKITRNEALELITQLSTLKSVLSATLVSVKNKAANIKARED